MDSNDNGNNAEIDLLSKETLTRRLTLQELVRLNGLKGARLKQTVVTPLAAGGDEEFADEDDTDDL